MTQLASITTESKPYVLPLESLSRQQISVVGGKAANLGELITARLPVPSGFCVTTHAYAAAALGPELQRIVDDIGRLMESDAPSPNGSADPSDAFAPLADAAREVITQELIPTDVEAAIRKAYAELCSAVSHPDTPVAVRSSATAEDLPGASFAGQQDTYLNIIGADAVVNAVRRCWASLWTDRAVAYRARNHIDPHGVKLAVVVQQQIQSAVAGVMFTANPITGRRSQAVIDASPGLGEAVVSGAVTPDHFVVDTASGLIVERRLGDKRLRIEALPGGGTQRIELPASPDSGQAASLTDAQLEQLVALARRVEGYYGEPQDTEWAFDATGALCLLQSRPITTLYPLPESALFSGDSSLRVYLSFNVAQGVYQPLTPTGLQAFKLVGSGVAQLWGLTVPDPSAGPPAMAEAGHRLFLDITALLRNPIGRELLPHVLKQAEARSAQLLESVLGDPRLGRTRGSRVGSARRLARFALRTGVALGVVRAIIDPEGARRRSLKRVGAFLRRAELPESATASQRLERVSALPAEFAHELLPYVAPLVFGGLGAYAIAQRLLRGIATAEELDAVRRGLPHNPTTEMDLALWDLAQRARSDLDARHALTDRAPDALARDYAVETLPATLQRGLADFLSSYGHRGVAEIDLGVPHWGDDPTHILGVLANYLAQSDPALAPDAQFRRVAAQADILVAELADRAGRRSVVRGRAVRFLLERFRRLGGLREAPKFHLVRMLYAMRRLLAPMGGELAHGGRLDHPNDVYLLTLPELRAAVAGADVRPIIRRRSEELAFEAQRRRVPRFLLSDGTDVEALAPRTGQSRSDGGSGMLEGSGASSGRVTAIARVILDPHGARLEPGEILVAPSTDPGWTPLFLTAGGLVMEMGGPMSHGAIVAREYGIPAVVGVPNATATIQTGQQVTVDGSAGTVKLENSTA
jgi:rifampicin phosphotransferase